MKAKEEQKLEEFRDNERRIPTILTSSRMLSTGVDARNVRHIVLMRPIKSMIEFKQIIGRGQEPLMGKIISQSMILLKHIKNSMILDGMMNQLR